MVITVTLNPALDKTLIVPRFTVDAVNRVERIMLDPGGKGINVSKSVHAMGGATLCLGIIGGDTGRRIQTALDEMGIEHDLVVSRGTTRTNTKIVDLCLGTNTDVNEPGEPVTQELLDAVWEKLSCAAKPGDMVVFAGKNPPNTPDELFAVWSKRLRTRGVHICLDTVGRPMELALKEQPCIIKPNREELCDIVGRRLETDAAVIAAAKELAVNGAALVAVSMGAEGAIFAAKERVVRAYCPKVPVVSTVGAGDAMMAALALCHEAGLPLEETARRATAVATATVQVSGSQPAGPELIEQTLPRVVVDAG